jgi:hypothetical protein
LRTWEGLKVAKSTGRFSGKLPKLKPAQELRLIEHWADGAEGRGVLLVGDTIVVTPGAVRVSWRAGTHTSAEVADLFPVACSIVPMSRSGCSRPGFDPDWMVSAVIDIAGVGTLKEEPAQILRPSGPLRTPITTHSRVLSGRTHTGDPAVQHRQRAKRTAGS